MFIAYIIIAILALGVAIVVVPSSDPLNPNITLAFAKLLLKYLPGQTAPLRVKGHEFLFTKFQVQGNFNVTNEDIAVFDKAVRSSGSPFFLVAKTTPLVVSLLSDLRCPIKPLGAVNTRNIIRFLRPDSFSNLTYVATFGSKPGIRRKRGVEFCITIDVMSARQLVIQMELWMLQFLPSSHEPRFKGEAQEAISTTGDAIASLKLTPLDPLLWAKSCKDYNPIHVSTIGANLFGFRSVIAHGNHVAALALQRCGNLERPFTLQLEFLRPMLLPATVTVLEAKSDTQVLTVVSGKQQKAHMRMITTS